MRETYSHDAAETMKRNGKSFWFASLFLPAQVAEDAARLYAFCRRMDDLADVAVTHESREVLTKVRQELRAGISDDPVVADFLWLARKYSLPMEAADCLIVTFLEDAETRIQIENEQQLVRYCYGVAGTVGLMMSAILGTDRPRAASAAINLGIAMQMTNIARDVLEDAHNGRRYLPGSWMCGITSQEIIASVECRQDVAAAIEQLLKLADEYYASAVTGFPMIPARARRGIAIAAAVYREIGTVILQRRIPWWNGRVRLSLVRKLNIALNVAIGRSDLYRLKEVRPVIELGQPLRGLPGIG
jgi:phytoene synthase